MTKPNKKIIAINCGDAGSTGGLVISVLLFAEKSGFETVLACPNPHTRLVKTFDLITTRINRKINHVIARLFDMDGFCSKTATKHLVSFIAKENPSTIFLNNLHDYFIDLPVLISYLKGSHINVVWAFHDCWGFTGKCTHYLPFSCEKWQHECNNCPALKDPPKVYLINHVKKHFCMKKNFFDNFPNLTIVCPSLWLKNQLSLSIAKTVKTVVINNAIDPLFFESRTPEVPFVRNKKFLVFSVAYPWGKSKGLDIINFLATLSCLSDFEFLVAGLSDGDYTRDGITRLPKISKEMVKFYMSISDVFLNPSKAETFGLTNVEAQACGTPVIILNNSGGAEETIIDGKTGFSIDANNIEYEAPLIAKVAAKKEMLKSDCKKWALNFTNKKMGEKYLDLFL